MDFRSPAVRAGIDAGSVFYDGSRMLILVSADFALFGGNAFIAWMTAWIRRVTIPISEPIGLARSIP